MSGFDFERAMSILSEFVDQIDMHDMSPVPVSSLRGSYRFENGILERAQVVEPILDRFVPGWESKDWLNIGKGHWARHRSAAVRARGVIRWGGALKFKSADSETRIAAADLHPWVWHRARSQWQSGHFTDAVKNALIQVNSEAQQKSGRTDISEHNLFKQLFSTDPPKPGAPRLQRTDRSDAKTFTSMQEGARALAEALYKGIRNPLNHRADQELTEQEALESLAAISILARWVEDAELVTAEEGAEA